MRSRTDRAIACASPAHRVLTLNTLVAAVRHLLSPTSADLVDYLHDYSESTVRRGLLDAMERGLVVRQEFRYRNPRVFVYAVKTLPAHLASFQPVEFSP